MSERMSNMNIPDGWENVILKSIEKGDLFVLITRHDLLLSLDDLNPNF